MFWIILFGAIGLALLGGLWFSKKIVGPHRGRAVREVRSLRRSAPLPDDFELGELPFVALSDTHLSAKNMIRSDGPHGERVWCFQHLLPGSDYYNFTTGLIDVPNVWPGLGV